MKDSKKITHKAAVKNGSKALNEGGFMSSSVKKVTAAALLIVGLVLIAKSFFSYFNASKLSNNSTEPQVIGLNNQTNTKQLPIKEASNSTKAQTPQTGSGDLLPIIPFGLLVSTFGVYIASKSRKIALRNFEKTFLKD